MEPTLLIVEDDAPLREVLVRALRAEGFAASAVASARELLEQAVAERPDVVVIDIGLPTPTGRISSTRSPQPESAPPWWSFPLAVPLPTRPAGSPSGAQTSSTK